MSTTLPLFSLLPNGGGSYPPSPTFSDPSFSGYDGAFDLKGGGLGNYNFPTPPHTSNTPSTSSYSSRHLSNYPQLIPPNFSNSSFPGTPDGDDPTSSFLDLDLSQPGPSTYHHHHQHHNTHSLPNSHSGHGNGQSINNRFSESLSHVNTTNTSQSGSFILDGEDYLQDDDDSSDEDNLNDQFQIGNGNVNGNDVEEELVKIEQNDQNNDSISNHGDIGGVVDGDENGEGGDMDNEEPLYVNAKQYHRILKRRLARARLEELNRLVRSRKPYLHESRHRHACSRPRGKGGRFLTAEEIEQMKKDEAEKVENGASEGTGEGTITPA